MSIVKKIGGGAGRGGAGNGESSSCWLEGWTFLTFAFWASQRSSFHIPQQQQIWWLLELASPLSYTDACAAPIFIHQADPPLSFQNYAAIGISTMFDEWCEIVRPQAWNPWILRRKWQVDPSLDSSSTHLLQRERKKNPWFLHGLGYIFVMFHACIGLQRLLVGRISKWQISSSSWSGAALGVATSFTPSITLGGRDPNTWINYTYSTLGTRVSLLYVKSVNSFYIFTGADLSEFIW